MSRAFPNESNLDKSPISGDVIRGGSIGINKVLGYFVNHVETDTKPSFTSCIISALTVLRNVYSTLKTDNIDQIEQAFVTDIRLFMEYYNTYLGFVKNSLDRQKKASVLIYFPNYKRIDKSLLREPNKETINLNRLYQRLISRTAGSDGMVLDLDNCSCFWIRAGDASYPHREVAFKFKDIVSHPISLYRSGDPIAMVSHIPFDFHITGRLRGIMVMESYTGLLKPGSDIRLRLDKSGCVPFTTITHLVFGDKYQIKPMVSQTVRKKIKECAEKEKWVTRTEMDIRSKVSAISGISVSELRRFDFV